MIVVTVPVIGQSAPALAPFLQDDFNRSDRSLDGDNGWQVLAGEMTIVSNEVHSPYQTTDGSDSFLNYIGIGVLAREYVPVNGFWDVSCTAYLTADDGGYGSLFIGAAGTNEQNTTGIEFQWDAYNDWYLGQQGPTVGVYNSSYAWSDAIPSPSQNLGVPYHYRLTYDENTGEAKAYINGQVVHTWIADTSIPLGNLVGYASQPDVSVTPGAPVEVAPISRTINMPFFGSSTTGGTPASANVTVEYVPGVNDIGVYSSLGFPSVRRGRYESTDPKAKIRFTLDSVTTPRTGISGYRYIFDGGAGQPLVQGTWTIGQTIEITPASGAEWDEYLFIGVYMQFSSGTQEDSFGRIHLYNDDFERGPETFVVNAEHVMDDFGFPYAPAGITDGFSGSGKLIGRTTETGNKVWQGFYPTGGTVTDGDVSSGRLTVDTSSYEANGIILLDYADHYCQATIDVAQYNAFVLRVRSAPWTSGWPNPSDETHAYLSGVGGGDLLLNEIDSGTLLQSINLGPCTNDTYRVEAVGNQVIAYRAGVEIGRLTTVLTGLYVGIGLQGDPGLTNLDDFAAGPV